MNRVNVARAVGLCLAGTGLFILAPAAMAAPAPEGSYQQSCRNFTASHGKLSAECKTRGGEWTTTELDNYRSCSGDISNNNGQLQCQRGEQGSGAPGGGAPGGGTPGGGAPGGTPGVGAPGGGTPGGGAPGGGTPGGGSPGGNPPGGAGYGGGSGAHDGNDNDSDHSRRGAPQGSYKDTCRNVQVDGDDLVAECRTRDGDWHRTTLDNYRECTGDISNDNGRLRCQREDGDHRGGRGDEDRGDRGDQDRGDRGDQDRGDRGGQDRGGPGFEPRGSYLQTCRHIRVEHGDLDADCRTRYGDWRHTSLDDFRDCRGDIANDNGRLVCSRGGDRRGRITLYRDWRFGGPSRSYDSDAPELGWFSDKASSAYVQGGRWQLCTRRFYRGRCVIVDRSIGNFNMLGINDRVESLRRVRW